MTKAARIPMIFASASSVVCVGAAQYLHVHPASIHGVVISGAFWTFSHRSTVFQYRRQFSLFTV